jgi:hypothetical protein
MYKKREFLRIGGFNIHVSFFEDTELSMRMIKEGKLMVDGELWVRTSTRRFRQMGYVKLFKINMTAFISALLRKPITTEYFESRKKKK